MKYNHDIIKEWIRTKHYKPIYNIQIENVSRRGTDTNGIEQGPERPYIVTIYKYQQDKDSVKDMIHERYNHGKSLEVYYHSEGNVTFNIEPYKLYLINYKNDLNKRHKRNIQLQKLGI